MQAWVQRIAFILSLSSFFTLFIISIDFTLFGFDQLLPALINGALGAALLWVAGIIVGEILVKAIAIQIDTQTEDLVEGGLLQRIHLKQKTFVPGGSELPYLVQTVDPELKKEKRNKKNATK